MVTRVYFDLSLFNNETTINGLKLHALHYFLSNEVHQLYGAKFWEILFTYFSRIFFSY